MKSIKNILICSSSLRSLVEKKCRTCSAHLIVSDADKFCPFCFSSLDRIIEHVSLTVGESKIGHRLSCKECKSKIYTNSFKADDTLVDSIFCPKCSSADVFKDTGTISKDLEELISECEDDIDDEDFDESEYEENMQCIANLQSRQGTTTLIGHHFAASFEELAERGDVDCFIVSTEDGFSPLGANRDFFAADLGIDDGDIRKIADWNRFRNDEISLIGLPSRNPSGKLRGVVLAASETSSCYEQFAPAFHSMPYRDFYYNVAYESISYAAKTLGARKIAISHLSGSGHFHEDIATCIAEALAHFCDIAENPKIDSFLFVGCCIDEDHLSGIRRLNREGEITRHKDIHTRKSERNGFEVISLDWREPPRMRRC